MKRLALASCAGLVLAASCASNSSLPPAPGVPQARAASGQATATFSVTVRGEERSRGLSPSAQSVVVSENNSAVATIDVAASSGQCTKAKSGARTCEASAHVATGAQTFDVTAYDQAKGAGNVLASGSVDATLHSGTNRPIRLALDGTPVSLALTMRDPYPAAGAPNSTTAGVSAFDADGNVIIGSYRSPVALADSDASGATKLSIDMLSKSSQHATLTYTGAALGSATITASMHGLRPSSLTFAPAPRILATYPAPMMQTKNGPFPLGVSDSVVGPDGNIWATGASSGAIVKISPAGKYLAMYPILGSGPNGITVGPDKDLWFAESQAGKIGKATIGGKITSYTIPVSSGATSQPGWVAPGPDGRIWFVDQGYQAVSVGAITTAGKITKYALPANSGPTEIVAGPDGNMWITDGGLNAIDVVSTAGKVLASYTIPTASSGPWGITVGPDKNIWFAEYAVNKIGRITAKGSVKDWAVPTAFAGTLNVASGPDGNVWFTESGGGFWNYSGKVGYITTDGRTIREFPNYPAGEHVHNLMFDQSGNLWYTGFSGPFSAITKFAY